MLKNKKQNKTNKKAKKKTNRAKAKGGTKGRFSAPNKLENHSSEGKERRRRKSEGEERMKREKAIVLYRSA